jgi:hypothetical protein
MELSATVETHTFMGNFPPGCVRLRILSIEFGVKPGRTYRGSFNLAAWRMPGPCESTRITAIVLTHFMKGERDIESGGNFIADVAGSTWKKTVWGSRLLRSERASILGLFEECIHSSITMAFSDPVVIF